MKVPLVSIQSHGLSWYALDPLMSLLTKVTSSAYIHSVDQHLESFQIGLWLVLIFSQHALTTTSAETNFDYEIPPWPVTFDSGELYICQANISYTPPSGPVSAVVDCTDFSCTSVTSRLTVRVG